MHEVILSVGIDIGTSTTQLIFSRLTIENRASSYTVPRIDIVDKEVIYRSKIYFTPLRSATEIDAEAVKRIVREEYQAAGMTPEMLRTGAVIITGETARKENANEVLEALSDLAGDFVVATAGPDLESVLSARGAGTDALSKEKRTAIANVDIGGGTTDVAILSLGEIVTSTSLKIAGDKLDRDLIKYVKESYKLLIGDRTAEEIKKRIGTAWRGSRSDSMDVSGRDLVTGLPHTITLNSEETELAMRESLQDVVRACRTVLEQTPPELSADIVSRGVVLTGGGALLQGIDQLLINELNVPVYVAENALSCVAEGTGVMLENLHLVR